MLPGIIFVKENGEALVFDMGIKIIFMGTPEFAVASLEKLCNHFNVAAVVTAPDKPAGRGQKLSVSAVKTFALTKGLQILQPASLKDPDFLNQLQSIQADLFVVVAFRMLPEAVWQMPAKGTINLHASLLPQYRGAAPINWAIINGETTSGVTTFFIEKEIDTGKIILQQEVTISPDTTAGELHDQLMQIGSELIVKTVKQIEDNSIQTIDQKKFDFELKSAPKIFREQGRIFPNKLSTEIYNQIRGLSPYPGAWAALQFDHVDYDVKIFKAKINEEQSECGKISSDFKNYIRIYTLDGSLDILELQFPGKKRMGIEEFLRGNKFEKIEFRN